MSTAKIIESLLLYCDAQENALVTLRRELQKLAKTETEPQKPQIPEDRFSRLSWKDENGAKIGPYQIAVDNQNDPQQWQHAFNILKANGAVIGKRFHEESFEHSYWLFLPKYDYKIFRQKLKEPSK